MKYTKPLKKLKTLALNHEDVDLMFVAEIFTLLTTKTSIKTACCYSLLHRIVKVLTKYPEIADDLQTLINELI